jgi:DNA-binding LytR/AlgR family response regulator
MIKALLVDDEPLALDILETYLEQIPDFELMKRCDNAIEAREYLKNNPVDVIFLDIQMPQLTGVDFVKTLTYPPLIVFTTAYPNFALEGFELNAIDYLLKPVSFDRFQKAIEKVRHKLTGTASKNSESQNTNQHEYIFVKADKKFVKINFNDMLYVEGLKDYVIIKTTTGRVITLQTMKSLEDKLPKSIFLRIHRSYIVNLRRISSILGNMVEIGDKQDLKQIPIGKNYRDELLEIIEENKL